MGGLKNSLNIYTSGAVGKEILLKSSNTVSDDDGRLANTWPTHPHMLWRRTRTLYRLGNAPKILYILSRKSYIFRICLKKRNYIKQ